jgi:dipeptidyl-peptidase-4
MDENVHFSLTMKVANALINENKDFDMLIVPNTDHSGVRGPYAVRRCTHQRGEQALTANT